MAQDRFEGMGSSYEPGEPMRDNIGTYGHLIDPDVLKEHQANLAQLNDSYKAWQTDIGNVELARKASVQFAKVAEHIFNTTVGLITPFLQGGQPGNAPIEAVANLPKIPGLPDIGGTLAGISGMMGKFQQLSGVMGALTKLG